MATCAKSSLFPCVKAATDLNLNWVISLPPRTSHGRLGSGMWSESKAQPVFFSNSSTLSFMFQMIIIFSSVWSFWFGAGTWLCPGLFLDQELFWVMITSNIWLQEWKPGWICARHASYLVLHPGSLMIHFDSVGEDDNMKLDPVVDFRCLHYWPRHIKANVPGPSEV